MPTTPDERLRRYLEQIVPQPTLGQMLEEQPDQESVPAVPTAPRAQVRRARTAVEKLAGGRELTPAERFTLEAIVIPDQRPAIDIVDGDFTVDHPLWSHFAGQVVRAVLRRVITSIGRIELPGHPTLPYGGTGFVVGPGLLMTNRHVAEIFAAGLGAAGLSFRPGLSAGIDFRRERGRDGSLFLAVRQVVMIHPYWDMALLRVDGLTAAQAPIPLSLRGPEELAGRDVAVIGYPAFDPRNDAEVQHTVFGGVYNVKRLQPGKLTGSGLIASFGKSVTAALHDSSTLGGNSGSAVIDVATGHVAAVHFAGHYLVTNYAVPARELSRDARVVDAGVVFAAAPRPEPEVWAEWWDIADPREVATTTTTAAPPRDRVTLQPDGAASTTVITVPLEISVRIGTAAPVAPPPGAVAAGGLAAGGVVDGALERAVEPTHDLDYSSRRGYDPDFLGVAVPLPKPTKPKTLARLDDGDHVIPYHHFSLAMHKSRRLALFTACNLDASPQRKRPEPGRDYTRKGLGGLGENDTERWFTDPRIPQIHQLPDRFFARDQGAFDRGHLVRREDVAWGTTYDQVRTANGDSFHTTNCSPQVAGFNRSDGAANWGALEDVVQRQAGKDRLSIMAGPVLAAGDRVFTGVDDAGDVRVQIPSEYWKVVLAADGDRLHAFAFVLEQDLADVPLEFAVDAPWRQHMIAIRELEAKLGTLRFPKAMHDADQSDTELGEAVRASAALDLVTS
jgi:endonuclease G